MLWISIQSLFHKRRIPTFKMSYNPAFYLNIFLLCAFLGFLYSSRLYCATIVYSNQELKVLISFSPRWHFCVKLPLRNYTIVKTKRWRTIDRGYHVVIWPDKESNYPKIIEMQGLLFTSTNRLVRIKSDLR